MNVEVTIAGVHQRVVGADAAHAATLGLNDKGIMVDGGTMGKFILKYPNGGQFEATLQDDGKVNFKFSGLGDDVKSWKSTMFIGIEYIQGGMCRKF